MEEVQCTSCRPCAQGHFQQSTCSSGARDDQENPYREAVILDLLPCCICFAICTHVLVNNMLNGPEEQVTDLRASDT